MDDKFLIQCHPWKMLKEAAMEASFPNDIQLAAMKKVMDGQTANISKHAKEGMKTAGLKTIYDLILWGLRTGVIRDKPQTDALNQIKQPEGTYEAYPLWKVLLHDTVMGLSDGEIQRHGMSKDSINYYRKFLQDKFGIGNSQAMFIRFAFATTNPIHPPTSTTSDKPFVSHFQKRGIGSKFPLVPSKFRPANIDPDIPIYDRSAKNVVGDTPKKVNLPRRKVPLKPEDKPKPIYRTTPIQTALHLMGIDQSAIYGGGKFWERPHEQLWNLLELAKKRYDYEIRHAHPDVGGNPKRASQLNAAWNLTKKLFAKHGYVLHR